MKKSYYLLPLLLICATVYAADGSPEGDPYIIMECLKGALMGLLTVFIGWSKKQDIEDLNWKGFLLRVPVGIVVGLIAGYKGMSFNDAMTFANGMGIILIIDNLGKMLIRRIPYLNEKEKELKKKLPDKLNLKERFKRK